MKKILLCIVCALGFATLVKAQPGYSRSVELGIVGGFTNYIGDLTERQFQFKRGAGGLMLRFNVMENISLRANVLYGGIAADDAQAEDTNRIRRNLHFKSSLVEFSGMVEINFFRFDPVGGSRSQGVPVSPYIFGGIGVFSYNPKALYNDEWIELQPLGTEGQNTTFLNERKKYSLTQLSFPAGLGIKFRLLPRFVVGFEYGRRFTNTDYLDDVSLTYVDDRRLRAQNGNIAADMSNRTNPRQEIRADLYTGAGPARGDNTKTDKYAFGGVTLSYTLGLKRTKCYSFN